MEDKFLLGGYTADSYTNGKHNNSEGIYTATLDTLLRLFDKQLLLLLFLFCHS